MAMNHDHMQFDNLRLLAMARAAFALLAGAEDQEGVLKVMNAEPGCRAAAGLTAEQEAGLLAATHDEPFSAMGAADVVGDIIATNHADDELAAAASRINLIATLRQIERKTRMDDDRTVALLRSHSPEAKAAAAAQAIFQLREIGRMVGPVLELLDVLVPQEYRAAATIYPEAAE